MPHSTLPSLPRSAMTTLPDLLAVLPLQDSAPPGGGGFDMLIMLGGVLLIMWFMMFLPERKARKKKQEQLDALQKNDKVLTSAGMYATVAAVHETDVVLKFDDGATRIRVLKSAIATVLSADDADG